MVAVAERPVTTIALRDVPAAPRAPGKAARRLADAYLRYVSAIWRGDPEGAFGTWLATCRRPELPPRPATLPDAFSPHGGGGRGIFWYETGGMVLGYVPGTAGGYRVAIDAIPPAFA